MLFDTALDPITIAAGLVVLSLIPLLILIWATAVVLGKAGFNPWLALLVVLPGSIFVGMIILAFVTWPLERAANAAPVRAD